MEGKIIGYPSIRNHTSNPRIGEVLVVKWGIKYDKRQSKWFNMLFTTEIKGRYIYFFGGNCA
jgi:hypothetical protein